MHLWSIDGSQITFLSVLSFCNAKAIVILPNPILIQSTSTLDGDVKNGHPSLHSYISQEEVKVQLHPTAESWHVFSSPHHCLDPGKSA
jgi:hypothetical protein